MTIPEPTILSNLISLPAGRYKVSTSTYGDKYRFDIPGIGEAFSDSMGNLLETRLVSGAESEVLQDALIGHIFPLLWILRGGFLLHASAVATPHGAILFFGPSGAGKSTLAASFENRGECQVLDDDSAFLERDHRGIWVYPTGRGISLWKDSMSAVGGEFPQQKLLSAYGGKYRLKRENSSSETLWPERGSIQGMRVTAAFHLPPACINDPLPAILEQMESSDKHLRLARSFQRLDLTDRDFLKSQFRFVSHFITEIPLQRLRFSRCYAALPEVQHSLLMYAKQLAQQ